MAIEAEKLARMANQIATFFNAYPHNEAVEGIRAHLTAFWTADMRHTLAHAIATGGVQVSRSVAEAVG